MFLSKITFLHYSIYLAEECFFGSCFEDVWILTLSAPFTRRVRGIAYVGFGEESDLKRALNKNRGFLGQNQVTVKRYSDPSKEKEKREKEEKAEKWKKQVRGEG